MKKINKPVETYKYKFLNNTTPVFEEGEWRFWYKSVYRPGELPSFSSKHYWVKLQLDMASAAADLVDCDHTYQYSDRWRVQARDMLLTVLDAVLPDEDDPTKKKYEPYHFLRYWADRVVDDEANYLWSFVFEKERHVYRFELDKKGREKDVSEHVAERMANEAKAKFEFYFQ
jgi:hypothetical protein